MMTSTSFPSLGRLARLVLVCSIVGGAARAATGAATQTSLAPGEAHQEYLKRDGKSWTRVVRDPHTAAVTARAAGAAPTAAAATPLASERLVGAAAASATSPFAPYVTYPTGSWPEAVAIGDVNGDGRNDVVMVTSYYFDAANDYMLHVWTQNADGTLAARVRYTIGGDPSSVAIGDVNNDGLNDVVVANGSGIGVFLQNAQGTLSPMTLRATNDAECVRVADLNHDGLLDVVSIGWGTNTASVFLQQSNGLLAAPVVYTAPHGGYDDLEVGDVNGDGLADVIVMSGQSLIPNLTILYQQSNGTLGGTISRSVGQNWLAGGIGVGDVTGDSRNDIVVGMGWAVGTPEIDVFPQQTDGTLLTVPSETRPMGYPEPVEVGDFTNDGRADVIAFDGYVSELGLFRQSKAGVLGTEERIPFPYATHLNRHGIAIGDINGDGYQDVVVANYNYGLVVYRNMGPQLTVTAPTGSIQAGMPTLVRWTADFEFTSFDVSYSVDGGASYAPMPGCQGLSGDSTSCTWTSPGPATNNGQIKVVGKNGAGAVLAAGVAPITIVEAYLTVTSPNTALVWPAGVTQAITWDSNLGPGATVAIDVSRDGGATWATLVPSAANTGYFLWSVTNPTTASARIRVASTAYPALADVSDVDFIIDRPPIASAGYGVEIELGSTVTLDASASSDPDGDPLSYTWYQGTQVIGTGASVGVTPVSTTIYSLTASDPVGLTGSATVTVAVEDTMPPVVMMESPIIGKRLDLGAPTVVAWTASDAGGLASFDVSTSGDLGATYSSVPSCAHLPAEARSCTWTPMPTQSGMAVVRVVGRDASGNAGAGGASYVTSAAPYLKLTGPDGHESWEIGSTRTISWAHNLGTGVCLRIDLSRNGGLTWLPLVRSACSQTETMGTYSWRVTGPLTHRARLRVLWSGHAINDASDADFAIVKPTVSPD